MPTDQTPGASQEAAEREIAALTLALRQTEQRLRELTGGKIHAVLHPGGPSDLHPETQERLRESEERFRNMFFAAATGIAISTPQGRFLHANAAYCRMLDYTEAELRERNFASLTHPEDLAVNLTLRDELLAGRRESFVLEKRYLRKGGATVWTRQSVSATHAAGGEITSLLVMAEDITERKRAEESVALFRNLIDRSPDAIEVIDPETCRYLDVNQTGCDRLGYSRDEMLSLRVGDIDPDNDYGPLWPEVLGNIKRAGFSTVFGRHRRKDGSIFPVEVNIRHIQLNREYIVAVVRDITQRKQLEARFRRLADSNIQGVFLWRANGSISEANDAFLRLVGYTRDDLEAGRVNWRTMTPPEWFERDQRALDEVARKGACEPYEKEYVRKDGSRVPILIGRANFEDNPEEGVCFVLDLTERKRIEGRFRRLIDSNAQGVMFWKAQGTITDANDAFLNLVGYSRDDLAAGRLDWQAMTPPEFRAADRRALDELAARGICKPLEKQWIRKDGSRVPILIGAAIFADNPEEGVCFMVDLTEQKRLEQQFLRAQRMESVGTLAGGVAHDLNNILAPIMMSIGVLKGMTDTPAARAILETIELSAKRGADIVRQVLSFARGLEGQRIEIQSKHLLKDLEHIIRDTFPKNLEIRFAVADDPWTILGDPTQVHQILLNLCVNARDAMPDGGRLTIGVENIVLGERYAAVNLQARPGRYARFTVTDTGTGIPPDIIHKIFEPFFTTKEIDQGTGLGLSTVMAIVKSHEGHINVYSVPGEGTTFHVYLPAAEVSPPSDPRQAPPVSLPRGDGETILVVDDEASILTIARQTLEVFGYQVLTARDGAEAVAIYAESKSRIALVLTDMMMPVMGGASVIRVLTRINPDVKIVAASGLAANGSGPQAPGPRVRHFLHKPYTAETLLKTLRAALHGE
jgi:PAS domain S-box-containing protein